MSDGPRRFRVRPRHVGLLLVAAVLLDFALTGVRTVEQTEVGVVLRFGKAVRTCPSGIHFILPWPVESFVRVRTDQQTLLVGILPEGKVRILRSEGSAAQWLTGDTNLVEIRTEIQYRVSDPVSYLYRVAEFEDGPQDLLLREVAESVLTRLIARMDVDEVLSTAKAGLKEAGRRGIQQASDEHGLGVLVNRVNIVEVSPPRSVIAAFNDVSSASADRDRLESEADGYAKDLLPRARAKARRIVEEAEIYRSEVVNRAKGAAARFHLLSTEVAAAPEVSMERLWREFVEEALSSADLVVYPAGRPFRLTEVK